MKSLPPHARQGFSLVEVMVAIGIAAAAITLMIGLLPAGLSTFREAMNTSVTAQIGQRLLYESAQTDYSVLVAPPATKPWRYFDDEGSELPDATGAIFHALIRIQPSTSIPSGTAGGTLQPNLATVIVQVALNAENRDIPITTAPGGPADPPEGTIQPDSGFNFTAFTGHVAKNL
ncbi:uncharacterized protein (TIGR02598 family) [Prosthecobacter fusiformis]|uniref:Uncharacterized protein (TIGR02598 family) n=1 Tax=Prosthecobacter fusiformis TaxID=48464 RepID=A0A4R7RQQ8_9BACT|nr:Verru_Chthon cassette protein B [Prosthecobacter fusiformis]TDU67198.1 uncharacterized protein (TIGR02598 family) [Prosthecobacter fusiformis]